MLVKLVDGTNQPSFLNWIREGKSRESKSKEKSIFFTSRFHGDDLVVAGAYFRSKQAYIGVWCCMLSKLSVNKHFLSSLAW